MAPSSLLRKLAMQNIEQEGIWSCRNVKTAGLPANGRPAAFGDWLEQTIQLPKQVCLSMRSAEEPLGAASLY